MINFQPGYILEVESWENDADNYQTKIVGSLSKEVAEVMFDIICYFKPRSQYKNCFGNSVIGSEDLIVLVEKYRKRVFDAFFEAGWDIHSEEDVDDSFIIENIVDKLIGAWNEGEYFRVMNSAKMYYTPVAFEPIICKNVNR